MSFFNVFPAAVISVCFVALSQPAPQSAKQQAIFAADGRVPLATLNFLVGDWRGVGQPRRGSNVGAWSETVSCAWDFSTTTPAIVLTADKGQQFESLRFFWEEGRRAIVLEQKQPSGVITYTAAAPEEAVSKLVLLSAMDSEQTVYRCTIQQLSDIRATVLLEKQTSAGGSFRRTAQIGYTRSGQRLAIAGANQRKCIVTGGLGTIPVTHQGKTYYVCCQGCVQAFQDAPDEIIADYQAALKKAAADSQPDLQP